MSTPFNMKLGPSGELLEVPENDFILKELKKTPPLNPRQLLSMAARYRNLPLMMPLADKLASHAMGEIIRSKNIQNIIKKVAKEEIEWSFFDDLWNSIVNAITGAAANPPAGKPNPFGDSAGCHFSCVLGFLLFENCPKTGTRLIGLCFGGSF